MWVCQIDVGREEPVQIVTGAWNVHAGDLVPVALHKSTLPGGVKIEKGKLRGEVSNGMLCGLSELGLDTRDFPYAAIIPAAILDGTTSPWIRTSPLSPRTSSRGTRFIGRVVCARCCNPPSSPEGYFHTCLDIGGGSLQSIFTTPAPTSMKGTWWPMTPRTRGRSALWMTSTPSRRSSPTASPTASSSFTRTVNPATTSSPWWPDDHVVEFEITPNRPDCLSIIGLAREASATFDAPLALHEPVVKGGGPGVLPELLDVETPAADLCPRYTARMVRNVKIAPSPKWMRERLRAMGVRPINNIVDITNYVMLEYGQPMHAFDYRYVKGGKIVVRRAEEGEDLTTLDGSVRKLTPNTWSLPMSTGPWVWRALWAARTARSSPTPRTWCLSRPTSTAPLSIRKGALALGMRTEASAKYEKGLDPMNTLPAVERACELVELLGAGEVLDGVIDILNYVPQPRVLKLEPEKINALLGTDIAPMRWSPSSRSWTSRWREIR